MFECEFEEQSRVIQSMVGRLTIYPDTPGGIPVATFNPSREILPPEDVLSLFEDLEKTSDFGDRFEDPLMARLTEIGLKRLESTHYRVWETARSVMGKLISKLPRFPENVLITEEDFKAVLHVLPLWYDLAVVEEIEEERNIFLTHLRLTSRTDGKEKKSVWHEPDEEKPERFAYGPIEGTKSELAVWVANCKAKRNKARAIDPHLRRQPDQYWAVKFSGQRRLIWFARREKFEAAEKRKLHKSYMKDTSK